MKLKYYFSIIIFLLFAHKSFSQYYFGGNIGFGYSNHSLAEVGNVYFESQGQTTFWKIFTGYQLDFFGMEVSYRDNGTLKVENPTYYFNYYNRGIDVMGFGRFQWKRFNLKGKAGAFYSNTTTNFVVKKTLPSQNNSVQLTKYSNDANETHFIYGVSLGIHLIRSIQFQIEYENIYLEEEQLSSLSFGLTYLLSKK
ncbi:hypothetical protein KMW28_14260 [Flammeovirga yaeyamensis]|uniref:Outer membrane protein OmpA-like transmembrane domain-containing protein n=1 Tax=Flammeovirga yaeyamensis TaxID=367791 RepID=A0AAX1N3W8_9BACT|nr:hypothetical protein [Flammeovirga yaeyamensis]MBB3700250.1 hypothetical protein [Flammeovirga yaeyamensis]NMF37124.1 hypothetical protein [Flammeovirga yaeyamensis]QWG00815.1 hypothetical protein KMW28_14260 [Flammeovirga yaeyamensis]